MPEIKKKLFNFSNFCVSVHSNDKTLINLCLKNFPGLIYRNGLRPQQRSKIFIKIIFNKTRYSKIPRHQMDCFHGFSVFYNRFAEFDKRKVTENRVIYDVGPRTLRTIIDPKKNSITSYIATPPDIEKDLLFDLIFFQPLKYLLQTKGLYLMHASCAAYNGKAVLFSGRSRSGKSVLLLSLIQNGFHYLSDERIKLYLKDRRSGIVCSAFSSIPKIKKDSLRFFPKLKKNVLKNMSTKGKHFIDVYKNQNIKKTTEAKPCLLIFPSFVKSARTRINPISKKAALNYLAREDSSKVKFSGKLIYKEEFRFMASLLQQAKTYRLYYRDSDLDKIPEIIKDLLKNT